LKHAMIPPNLHFHTPSPAIPWQDYALKIPTELLPWPHYGPGPHRALVCSYGIAGTNTYVVVEEAPCQHEDMVPVDLPAITLLPLSAHTPEALKELAGRYLTHLEGETASEQTLTAITATASQRRTHHEHRLAIVSCDKRDAHAKLAAFLRGEFGPEVSSGRQNPYQRQKMAWIFPGQGSQWLGMGRDLLEQEPVFRATIEQCDRVMRSYTDWSLLAQLQADETQTRLHEIDVIQPTLFAIEIALAELWRSWGITPDVVVGHSMGEAAAAYIAGALSLEDAAWIICARSKLLLRVSGQGAMAAVELSLEYARALLSDYSGRVSVGVSNSPNSTVLSGDPEALAEILALLEKQGIFGRLVNVDVASHSPQMDPLRADLLRLLERVQPRATAIPMFSTVNGALIDGRELTASYWVNNLREPILFSSAIQSLLADDYTLFLEISPHPILVGAIRQTIEQSKASGLALASLRRQEEGYASLLTTLCVLYTQGCDPTWPHLLHDKGQHVSLPKYPWQRQRCWNPTLDHSPMR
ncbi:MAG: acyltransferase domain-containing protein, partial [Ktedonobacteraceae bacterium]